MPWPMPSESECRSFRSPPTACWPRWKKREVRMRSAVFGSAGLQQPVVKLSNPQIRAQGRAQVPVFIGGDLCPTRCFPDDVTSTTGCQACVSPAVFIPRGFTGCGKTRFRPALYQGTTSVVPRSHSFLSSRGGFSLQGICFSCFLRSLFSRAIAALYFSVFRAAEPGCPRSADFALRGVSFSPRGGAHASI